MKNTTAHCEDNCPGCGMTFSPDPSLCPLKVFVGWSFGVELDHSDVEALVIRGAKFDKKGRTVIE